ncbi:hypothetical protein SDC9_106328 [bioreactor metagenome]|uniref:Uncharacterized protein n=1 Tax=bioreactor metagenome TaxID=1076179 RepID=A0A645BCP9_9ZZZZ
MMGAYAAVLDTDLALFVASGAHQILAELKYHSPELFRQHHQFGKFRHLMIPPSQVPIHSEPRSNHVN